jgi:hypothetical protein
MQAFTRTRNALEEELAVEQGTNHTPSLLANAINVS